MYSNKKIRMDMRKSDENLSRIIKQIEEKNRAEKEFLQSVREVYNSLPPFLSNTRNT